MSEEKVSLEEFDRRIRLYLQPMLPKKLRLVTDTGRFTNPYLHREQDGFVLFIIDQDKRVVLEAPATNAPTHKACADMAAEVAKRLMTLDVLNGK